MNKALLAFLPLAVCACAGQDMSRADPDYRFENGLWFDGDGFAPKTAYIVDGALLFSDGDDAAANVVDLEDGYVVPPFCEAHNHNLGGGGVDVDETVARYLEDGVYYVMLPGSFAFYRSQIIDKLNNPNSVDAVFANNGLTGSGGHPRRLRESLMARYGLYPDFTKETLPDKGYFEADTLPQLHEKWALILAERPDFVKAMLLHSEEYDVRKDDPDYYGRRGLNPDLLPELVRLVHGAGLRLAVHVETDADMATALRAGADIIAHLPSHDSDILISDETISLAAETNAAIVTTTSVAKRFEERDPERYEAVLKAQRENLSRLAQAGANLVLGSDNVMDTSLGEAEHLASLGALDNETILKMWTENCARTVFPDRKVGRLADGFEASFVVLDANPLEDFSTVRRINMRVKDGRILALEAAEDAAEDL